MLIHDTYYVLCYYVYCVEGYAHLPFKSVWTSKKPQHKKAPPLSHQRVPTKVLLLRCEQSSYYVNKMLYWRFSIFILVCACPNTILIMTILVNTKRYFSEEKLNFSACQFLQKFHWLVHVHFPITYIVYY